MGMPSEEATHPPKRQQPDDTSVSRNDDSDPWIQSVVSYSNKLADLLKKLTDKEERVEFIKNWQEQERSRNQHFSVEWAKKDLAESEEAVRLMKEEIDQYLHDFHSNYFGNSKNVEGDMEMES